MCSMATKKNDRGFAGIRTYAELEASLRMVRRQEEMNSLSRGVSRFMSGSGYHLRGTDLALLLIRALRRRLLR